MYNSKEKIFLGVLFLVALASLFFFLNFRTLAFPEHNITFDITREQAAEKSKEFVSKLGFNPEDFKETTVFSIDEQSKTYLEREVGVSETAQLAANDVDVWHFTSRFFKPLQKEEISVAFMPNGRLSGFSVELNEAEKGARLSKTLAGERAEAFLKETIHADLTKWRLVSGESAEKPNRIDHTFIWEKTGFHAKDSTYRMEVTVYGDKIGAYLEYLKVPEDWLRGYEKETSNNDLAQTIAEVILYLVFGLAILITFITEYRKNNLRLVGLKWFGILAGIIATLTALNSIPLTVAGYPTTISWEAFIGSIILISIVGGFFEGSIVYLIIAAGEVRFRQMFSNALSIEASIRSGFKTKPVNKALFVGTFFGILFFSYEILYYFFGKNVGFWAPADTNYTDIFSTVIPWIYPLFIGFSAAATEEGIFRLFGIPFLKKYVKKTWIAIIITAFVWGFLHSNYPQSPWFVRGIEIGLMGIVLGWMFVRFGFLANFTAHYTFNALQTAIYFFASGSIYASISSTIVSLLPFLIAVFFLGRALYKKGFDPVRKDMLNSGLPALRTIETKENGTILQKTYTAFSQKRKQWLIGLALASFVTIWLLYPKTSIDQVPQTLGREEISAIAEKTLKARSVDTDSYHHVTSFTPENIGTEQDYILDVSDYNELRKIYPDKLPIAIWTVRYFKPLQKEEYSVEVLPNGKIYQVAHILDEKANGENLSAAEARELAENYLKSEKGYDLSKYKLVENKAEKKAKRTDYRLVFEEKDYKVKDATFRTSVVIQGSEVSGYLTYLKLPETWLREKNQTTTLDFISGAFLILAVMLLGGFCFRTFLVLSRDKQINFRNAYKIAAVATAFTLISTLNIITTFSKNYDTAIPFSSYVIQSVLGVLFSLVVTFFIVAMIVGMFLALWKQHIGRLFPEGEKEQAAYVKDAMIAGYSVPLIVTAVSSIIVYILTAKDLLKTIGMFDAFPQVDSYLPFVAVLSEFPIAVAGACFIGIAALVLKRYLRKWRTVVIVLIVVAAVAGIPTQHRPDDIVTTVLQNIILLSAGLLIIAKAFRNNLLAYFVMLYYSLFFAGGWVLFVQPNLFLKVNGIILLILALLPLLLFPKYKSIVQFLRRSTRL